MRLRTNIDRRIDQIYNQGVWNIRPRNVISARRALSATDIPVRKNFVGFHGSITKEEAVERPHW